jgi:intracellular multiplication protein IcmJ
MSLLTLTLSASKNAWQAAGEHGRKDSPHDSEIHAIVSKKYKHTCQYCGWVDAEHNEVSHLDENHSNNEEANLTLACPLCHQCLHLGHVGTAEGGKMIWAPELSQIEINHLARAYWLLWIRTIEIDAPDVKAKINELFLSAKSMVSKIEHQSHVLEAHYVPGASDPAFWAEALMKLPKEQYEKRHELLRSIRVWPTHSRFKGMVRDWQKSVNINIPLDTWSRFAMQE